jgi:hypothetical protein
MTWRVLSLDDAAFVPRYRVTGALVCAKGQDGLLRHCYKGDLLDYLNPEQREHFLCKSATAEAVASARSPRPPGVTAVTAAMPC